MKKALSKILFRFITVFLITAMVFCITSCSGSGIDEADMERYSGHWDVVKYEMEDGISVTPDEVAELAEVLGTSVEVIDYISISKTDVLNKKGGKVIGTDLVPWIYYTNKSHDVVTEIEITSDGIIIGSLEFVWEDDFLVANTDNGKMYLKKAEAEK